MTVGWLLDPGRLRKGAALDQIAIISDIHGNVPALEATLRDIRERGIVRIVCLGDLVGKGPHSDVVVDVCRDACETVVRGNWDDALATDALKNPMIQWHRDRLGTARLEYLRSLPNVLDLTISGRHVRLFHASQRSVHYRVQRNDSEDKLLAMFENTAFTGGREQSDVVGYGDIHEAFVLNLQTKTLFNVGSVGNPLDTPQASYAILQGRWADDHWHNSFDIVLARVPYDIDRAIQDAIQAQMPGIEPYAKELRTAQYRGSSEFAAERDILRNLHGT